MPHNSNKKLVLSQITISCPQPTWGKLSSSIRIIGFLASRQSHSSSALWDRSSISWQPNSVRSGRLAVTVDLISTALLSWRKCLFKPTATSRTLIGLTEWCSISTDKWKLSAASLSWRMRGRIRLRRTFRTCSGAISSHCSSPLVSSLKWHLACLEATSTTQVSMPWKRR